MTGPERHPRCPELAWLRLMVAAEMLRSSRSAVLPLELTEDVRRHLLAELTGEEPGTGESEALRRRAGDLWREPAGHDPTLSRLCRAFGLSDRDGRLLVLIAAPDLDSRFGYLYGVVLGDPTRRAASPELAARLLAEDAADEWDIRDRLDIDAPLRRHGLVSTQSAGPFPFSPLRLPATIVHLVATGRAVLDPDLAGCAQLAEAGSDLEHTTALGTGTIDRLRRCAALWTESGHDRLPVLVLTTEPGAPTDPAVAALAALTRRPSLRVCLDRVAEAARPPDEILDLVRRDARAAEALLVVTSSQPLTAADPATSRLLAALDRLFLDLPDVPVVVVCRNPAPPLQPPHAARIHLAPMTTGERVRTWHAALRGVSLDADAATIRELSATFLLDPAQISAAAADAAVALRLHPDRTPAHLLRATASARSAHELDTVARRITPVSTWDDLVVPASTHLHLRELAAAARYRRLAADEWGLRGIRASGVTALFHGRSGTGKTTAAEVLANDLGVDLYVVDLATVISKWIGETEKNLRRVFDAARTANAVLLFDEADALFGRRSEVKDAHDRYANTEVAYLLQLMDDFNGVAVLSSNLTANMDPAFSRRLRYAIEFPTPDAALRARLWHLALPPAIPAERIDVHFAAERFELTGGDIRNAALHVAALATADGGVITMPLLMLAIAREFQKQHRVLPSDAFGPWYDQIAAHLCGQPSGVRS